MNNVDRLLTSKDPDIREMGQKAVRYKAQLEQSKLSQEEYERLCRQLVALREVDQAAKTAEIRQEFQQAVQIARAFLGVLM